MQDRSLKVIEALKRDGLNIPGGRLIRETGATSDAPAAEWVSSARKALAVSLTVVNSHLNYSVVGGQVQKRRLQQRYTTVQGGPRKSKPLTESSLNLIKTRQ